MKSILALPIAALLVFPAAALEFRLEDTRLVVSGPFRHGDDQRFASALQQARQRIEVVHFRDSPGGLLIAGLNIGRMLREQRIFTTVSGYCASSCALAFLGGAERSFADDQPAAKAMIGIHGVYDMRTGDLAESIVPLIYQYIQDQTGGRTTRQLLEQWTRLKRQGMAWFFHPDHDAKQGASLLICEGEHFGRDAAIKPEACDGVPTIDAYRQGIVTTTRLWRTGRAPR
jgi:hypothetical protein